MNSIFLASMYSCLAIVMADIDTGSNTVESYYAYPGVNEAACQYVADNNAAGRTSNHCEAVGGVLAGPLDCVEPAGQPERTFRPGVVDLSDINWN